MYNCYYKSRTKCHTSFLVGCHVKTTIIPSLSCHIDLFRSSVEYRMSQSIPNFIFITIFCSLGKHVCLSRLVSNQRKRTVRVVVSGSEHRFDLRPRNARAVNSSNFPSSLPTYAPASN